jgi:hypothetical protein
VPTSPSTAASTCPERLRITCASSAGKQKIPLRRQLAGGFFLVRATRAEARRKRCQRYTIPHLKHCRFSIESPSSIEILKNFKPARLDSTLKDFFSNTEQA